MSHLSLHSPLGPLTVFERAGTLIALEWGWAPDCGGAGEAVDAAAAVLREAGDQLDAYFDGRLDAFNLPLDPAGTDFQKRVWRQMSSIPKGETRTYGEIAIALNSAARPVGGACGRNPIPIIIPCHRVLASVGLGGYSGSGGLDTKKFLLRLEGLSAH